jgi:hypothetical protein
VAADAEQPERYAIFRTRLQPFTIGHQWAIKNFLDWSRKDNGRYTFGATRLILAIVDPVLVRSTQLLRNRPRLDPVLNPLTEWMAGEMAHTARCSLNGTSDPPDCQRVRITYIPSPSLLSDDYHKSSVSRELRSRLPLDNGRAVWYFPCFDQEDLDDISTLWWAMRGHAEVDTHGESVIKPALIPESSMVVSYSSQFNVSVKERKFNPVGVYFAGLVEMSGAGTITYNHHARVIPKEIARLISSFEKDNGLNYKDVRKVARNQNHVMWKTADFTAVDPKIAYHTLKAKCESVLGGHFGDYLAFLAEDDEADQARRGLERLVRDILDALNCDAAQRVFGNIQANVSNPLAITSASAYEICDDILAKLDTDFPKRKDLKDSVREFKDHLRTSVEGA